MAKKRPKPNPKRLILAITGLSLVAIGLLAVRLIHSDSTRYTILYWNLVLAALAPLLAWWFV